MSQYCYKSEKAPPGAVDPNGLECDCTCPKPKLDDIQAGYVFDGSDENLYFVKGKMVKAKIPKRIVPNGENRRTAHWGGLGETNAPVRSLPKLQAKLSNKAGDMDKEMFIEPRF